MLQQTVELRRAHERRTLWVQRTTEPVIVRLPYGVSWATPDGLRGRPWSRGLRQGDKQAG